jgi:glycosyltransferase involved in cell wall biosynthesis
VKILHISSAMTLGGGESHVADLVTALSERGHEVHLAVRPRSPLVEKVRPARVVLHDVALRNSLDLWSAGQVARLVREHGIEILHAHLGRDYLPTILAARMAGGGEIVLTRHHYLPLGNNLVYRRALRRVARVIAVSEGVRRRLIADAGLDPRRVVTIPNWVCLDEFARLPEREAARARLGLGHRFVITTIGRLVPAKGQEDVIRAAEIVARRVPEGAFLLIGDDPDSRNRYEKKLRDLIHRLGLHERVRLLGYRSDLRDVWAATDLVVVPSHEEAFSLVLIQAMAAGIPTIAYRTGGPAEILSEGDVGRLVPVGDVAALAAAIVELLTDAKLRARYSRAGRAAVVVRFDRNAVITRIEALYREVLSSDH